MYKIFANHSSQLEKHDVDNINLFFFKLRDAISKFVVCRFEELEATFYEHYKKTQTYEQMYMAL
jgi:hypothetical protein